MDTNNFDYNLYETSSTKKKEKKWKDFDNFRKGVLGKREWRADWENPERFGRYKKKHPTTYFDDTDKRKTRDIYKQVLYNLWDWQENDVRLLVHYDLEDPGPIDNNLNITVVACSSDNNYIPALYNKSVNGDINTPMGNPKSVMDQDNMTVKMTIGNGEWPRPMTENTDTSYATFNNEVKSMFFNKKPESKHDKSNGNLYEPLAHYNAITNTVNDIMGYCSEKLGYNEKFSMINLGVEDGFITTERDTCR